MAEMQLASNYYGTRAHYCMNLKPVSEVGSGRLGTPLCTRARPGWTVVYDQAAMDEGVPIGGWKRYIVDDLPLCKRCVKARERMETSDV